MRKKLSVLFILAFLLSTTILPSSAAISETYREVNVIHTEDGYEIETTLIVYESLLRANTKRADKISTVKYSGDVIAQVTLSALFGFDGNSAWVESTDSSYTTYNGWSYGSEEISTAGGTASLYGEVSKLFYRDIIVNISIACSASGLIS